jgi:hypothetical protein
VSGNQGATRRPSIDRLLWNAKTFGRKVVQRYFADWHPLTGENRCIWDAYYILRPAYEPWDTWQTWMAEYRTLVATAQDVYEAQHGWKARGHRSAREAER